MRVANQTSLVSEKKYYGKKYLNDECHSKDFLSSISYAVQLKDLLQIRKSCSYHENMKFTPVLFEIMVQRLKDYYRGNYLLQLWNSDGVKVYEKILKYEIIAWNIFNDYLVFKISPKEEDTQWIYIVNFKQEFKEIKVQNFVTDPSYIYLGINQRLFYYGNRDVIKVIDIEKDFGSKKCIEIHPKPDEIVTYEIKSPSKLHGFFENEYSRNDQYIMCLIETIDNQIDFARLYFWSRDVKSPDLEFYQYREVVQRDLRNDPVVKISQVMISNEFQFGLALRNSGLVDIYWNFTLTQTPEEHFLDVSSNFQTLYLKQQKPEGVKVLKIDIKWDSRIGVDVADEIPFSEEFWFKIQDSQLKNFVRLFSAITLINTTFLVAYNNVVSTFDIIKKLWLDHYIQDDTIVDLLRNQKDPTSDEFMVGILLKNGNIIPLESTQVEGVNIWKISNVGIQSIGTGVQKIVADWRDISSYYIEVDAPNGKKILGYQNCLISELNSDVKLKSGDYMVRYISPNETEDIAMLNVGDGYLKVQKNNSFSDKIGGNNRSCSVTLSKKIKITDSNKIEEKIHTVVEAKDNIFLFDTKSIYIFNTQNKSMNVVKDMNIVNLQVIDGDYIYAMANDCPSKNLTSGFYFYDLNQLVEKAEESFNFKLKSAVVGVNNLIDYYRQDERIAYMTDYTEIKIVPILHRNVINFMGMQKRNNYLCYYRQKDKLIALDKNNTLTTWNICTGKVTGQYKLKIPIVSENYEIYKTDDKDITYNTDWYMPNLLLIDSVTEYPDVDQKAFFGDRLYTSLPNNTAYSAVEEKKFRSFKMIQIVNETEVKENFTFLHAFYGYKQYQRIYFSTDLQYMLERLQNQRVFLYKREDTATPGIVKWNLIRRIRQFPMDLSECTHNNYLFSPDLMYYLDFDKSDNCFLIRKSIDQTTKCLIPKGIMNPASEEPVKIGKRFRWVDSQVIKVINTEGIEKIIDISNGFKDINQDTVPMINLQEQNQENTETHYYFQPKNLSISDTEKRLVRKFQRYNSKICLESITDKDILYDTLFEIDFSTGNNYSDKIVVDMSFTFIHWKLAEILSNPNQKIKLKKFSINDIKQTVLNIFPKGNTVLHYSYKQLNNIRKMYDIINNYNDSLGEGEVKYEIPFVQNFKGLSPLHLCVDDYNYKSAEVFLQKLATTPLDSHSRAIVDIVHKLVENRIPSLGSYLDNRMMQTQQLINRGYKRGAILYKEDMDYAVNTCELWPDIDNVDKLLFCKDPKESEIKLEFLDMPRLHSYSQKSGDDFFKALADSDDIDLFQYRSIQALIDYKWALAREYTVRILFIPFLFYHATFLVYSNVFNGQYSYEENTDGSMWIGHNCLAAMLYVLSIYFLLNEIRQLYLGGFDYFKSIWNYSDILPPVLIIITISLKLNIFYNKNYEPNNILYTIHSLATLLMWVKLLYFLRIFKSTGYLVRTLTDVIYDMKIFLLLLFIVYFGFGEAFLRLSEKSAEETQFIQNYAYAWVYSFRLSIGDNATDTFNDTIQPVTLWILWVIAGILTNIVMLNLLISIISESFAKINEKSKEANYQERARIISENSYLIPQSIKHNQDDFDKYIIVAAEMIDTQDDEKQAILNQGKVIEDSLNSFKEDIVKKHNLLEEKIEQLLNIA